MGGYGDYFGGDCFDLVREVRLEVLGWLFVFGLFEWRVFLFYRGEGLWVKRFS